MRLWTIHPGFLDAKGLVAAWREALLAQKVLAGGTKGYRHHPQLMRFQSQANPFAAIATFLAGLAEEAHRRNYHFDTGKIPPHRTAVQIVETRGQLDYEWTHLMTKLRARSPQLAHQFRDIKAPSPHPLFLIVPGEVRDWEKLG